jgi:hypothetical protein
MSPAASGTPIEIVGGCFAEPLAGLPDNGLNTAMGVWRLPAMGSAGRLPLDGEMVAACIDPRERPQDADLAVAFARGLAALAPAQRRGALAGLIGHLAESVAESLLVDAGWSPVWHFVGPGRHGVDLLVLDPNAERVFAVEVKGTLRPNRWPSMRRGELAQMDVTWLDKTDNPAMVEWGITSADVFGALVLVNLHDLVFKVALTCDFCHWRPIQTLDELNDVAWLEPASESGK